MKNRFNLGHLEPVRHRLPSARWVSGEGYPMVKPFLQVA